MPTGDVLLVLKANFNKHVTRDVNGCLRWVASKNKKGYGRFAVKRKVYNAHVVAWLLAGNSLLITDDVDHLCEVKDCVEITHLEAVSHSENKRGYRSCRACVLARSKKRG